MTHRMTYNQLLTIQRIFMSKIYVGIDPGKDGAVVAIMPDGEIKKWVVPKINTEYDKKGMFDIISEIVKMDYPSHFVLENINGHAAKGRTSAFVMGLGKGLWEMALVAAGASHTFTKSTTWQKVAWEGVKVVKVPCSTNKSGLKTDTKATSLIAAKRLFPNVDLTGTKRAYTPHSGIVDALLMAEYARRKL